MSEQQPRTEPTSDPAPDPTPDTRHFRGLPSTAIRRPIGTLMVALSVLVLGAFFLSRLPLDLLPRVSYPQLRASITNRGVEPEVLEETIAKQVESALATTEGISKIETEIQEGNVGVNLTFEFGTDVDFALQDASKNLDRVRSRLPEEADPPTIFKFDPSQIPIFEAAFSSSTLGPIELRDWIDQQLRPQMLTVQGIASVDISGGLVREIQVILDQERLRSYGLTVSQVVNALADENQDVAAGRVQGARREVVAKTAGKFRNVEQIRRAVIPLPGGARIPLSDVAVVRDTSQERRLYARLDNQPAVRISVRKQPDANTVEVADGVAKRLATLQRSGFFPEGVVYRVTDDQSNFIRASVNSVKDAAIGGALLTMIVVLLFLGSLRKTFVVAISIPLALFATFAAMGLFGLTLNIMSLGGLALGVGLLLDNAIMMLENIFRRTDELGEDPETAAHAGAAEVKEAVLASTTTNVAAVIPFLLISGLAALIFRELILTITFAIVAAYPVALTVVPMLSAKLARVKWQSGIGRTRPLRWFEAGVARTRNGYRRVAERAIRHRWITVGLAVASLAATLPLTGGLGNEFLPQVDDGNITVGIVMPPGSSPEETNRTALEIERMVAKMPAVQSVFTTAGGQFFGQATAERAGRGNVSVRLVPPDQREISATEWTEQLNQQIQRQGFPGARISARPPRIRGLRTSTSNSDISVTLQGEDLRELARIGEEVIGRLRGLEGLEGLQPSTEEASPQLSIRLDRERAAFLGLDVATVGQTLRTALDGTIATRFTEGNREYDVRVRFPREQFSSPDDVEGIALFPTLPGSPPVYVRDVAEVRSGIGPSTVLRENQNRVFRITGDVNAEESTVGEVNAEIRKRLADYPVPEGYAFVFGGEEEAIQESSRQLRLVIGLALFLVFVVLAVQYESLVNPFVILLAVPLSLVGVALSLWITNTPLSAPVLLGVILLAGVVVNNSIMLVEYIESFREDASISMEQAAVDAGAVRFRPILMTTLTAVVGTLPLALGLGEGSELMQPLAVVMVGGVLVSTLLTLFVVPCAYVILNRGAERLRGWIVGGRPSPAIPNPPQPAAGD